MWFTGQIKSLKHRSKSNPTVRTIFRLKSIGSSLAKDIATARYQFECQLIHKFSFNNSLPIYNYIRSYTKQPSLPSVMYLDKCHELSNLGKAEIFNQFFRSVFSRGITPSAPFPSDHSSTLCDEISFSEDDVFYILSDLDVTKGMGIDNIPNQILKMYASTLTKPIHHVFLQCVSQSYIPLVWKTHMFVPIFKSGVRSSVKNYCPISLLCCISKSLEMIIPYSWLFSRGKNSWFDCFLTFVVKFLWIVHAYVRMYVRN